MKYPLGNSIVVLNSENPQEVLVVRRPNGSNLFCFPGGKQEIGETSLYGALRELLEETGVSVHAESVTPVYSGICPGETSYWVTSYVTMMPRSQLVLTGEVDIEPQWMNFMDFLVQSAFEDFNEKVYHHLILMGVLPRII